MNRQNPWIENHLYFRYGFWDIRPNANLLYHSTPRFRAIETSSLISPRAFRNSQEQGLGGGHDVSISTYGSLTRALCTTLFMYRIWQIEKGLLSRKELKDITGWSLDTINNLLQYNGSAGFVSDVAYEQKLHDPNVVSGEWARDTTEDDFAIIVFEDTSKHLFLNKLDFRQSKYKREDTIIPPFCQPSIERLREVVGAESYFGSRFASLNYLFYDVIRDLIISNETAFTFGEETSRFKNPKLTHEILFGEAGSYPLNWQNKDLIEFENMSIDLRPQAIAIKDLCAYNRIEQEFRVFREVPLNQAYAIFTIKEVLEEAAKAHRGVEPFLWDMRNTCEIFPQTIDSFEVSTWFDS